MRTKALFVGLLAVGITSRVVGQSPTMPDLGSDPGCVYRKLWGPYDPKPGHPTPPERHLFLQRLSTYAKNAEKNTGIPAAAIAAMAIIESGYGFTRLALNAHNLLGYKYPIHSEIVIEKYTLHNCFAESGADKDYAKFPNEDAGIQFVAMRLSTLPRYSRITQRYASISFERRTKADVQQWVSDIAKAGYASNPDQYANRLIRVMNNPESPGDSISKSNLYQLSLKHAEQ